MKPRSYVWCVLVFTWAGLCLGAAISVLQFFWSDIAAEVLTWVVVAALGGGLLWIIVNDPDFGGGAGTHRGY